MDEGRFESAHGLHLSHCNSFPRAIIYEFNQIPPTMKRAETDEAQKAFAVRVRFKSRSRLEGRPGRDQVVNASDIESLTRESTKASFQEPPLQGRGKYGHRRKPPEPEILASSVPGSTVGFQKCLSGAGGSKGSRDGAKSRSERRR